MTQTLVFVPGSGMNWTNLGGAGTAYNPTCFGTNLYHTSVSDAPMWGAFNDNSFVCIPSGSATNNQNTVSWEIGIRVNVGATSRFMKIWDKAYGGYSIYLDTMSYPNNYLTINRVTTGGSGQNWYIPTTTPLVPGHDYYIQISWAAGTNPATAPHPTIYIGKDAAAPVHQTSWDDSGSGSIPTAQSGTGAWYNDSVGPANIGNTSANSMPCGSNSSARQYHFNGHLYVFRQYNTAQNFSGGGTWAADKWRWTASAPPPSSTTISTISTQKYNPVINSAVTFTARLTTSAGAALSGKNVTIWHYIGSGGTRYDDVTKTTDSSGYIYFDQTFGSTGLRTYYSTFAGDSTYSASTSSPDYIYVVSPTRLSLEVPTEELTPSIGEDVHFTATLTDIDGVPIQSEGVTIKHVYLGVGYNDISDYTDENGQIFLTVSFTTAGSRMYEAEFLGDYTWADCGCPIIYIEVSGTSEVERYSDETATMYLQEDILPNTNRLETITLALLEAPFVSNTLLDETATLAPTEVSTLPQSFTRAEILTLVSIEIGAAEETYSSIESTETIELTTTDIDWGVDNFDTPVTPIFITVREIPILIPEETSDAGGTLGEESEDLVTSEEPPIAEITEGEVV